MDSQSHKPDTYHYTNAKLHLREAIGSVFKWRLQTIAFINKGLNLPTKPLFLSSLMINILSLMFPFVTLQAYDRIIPYKGWESLSILLVALVIALLLESTLRLIRSYLLGWTGSFYEHTMFCLALHNLLSTDYKGIYKKPIGSYMDSVLSITKLREYYSGQAILFLIELPFIIIYMILIAYVGGILVIVPIVLILFFFYKLYYIYLSVDYYVNQREKLSQKRLNLFVQTLKSLHSINHLSAFNPFLRRYERLQSQLNKVNYFIATSNGKLTNLIQSLSHVLVFFLSGLAALLVMENKLSMGAMAACILMAGRIIQPIHKSTMFFYKLIDFNVIRRKVDEIFLPVNPELNQFLETTDSGYIKVENLAFNPDDFSHSPPSAINFVINQGENVFLSSDINGIETKILRALSGLELPETGHIYLNEDYENRPYTVKYLDQDYHIFQGTIYENLTLFESIPFQHVKELAIALGLDNIIRVLPLGYETPLNNTNSDIISPTIKKKITLVRALAQHPKILLLNYVEMGLDEEGLRDLVRYLKNDQGLKAIIMATNSPLLAQLCNREICLL